MKLSTIIILGAAGAAGVWYWRRRSSSSAGPILADSGATLVRDSGGTSSDAYSTRVTRDHRPPEEGTT